MMLPLVFSALAALPDDVAQAIWVAELRRSEASTFKPWIEAADPEVRARAALALGRVQHAPEALPMLRVTAGDPDAEVRLSAAFALGITPGSGAILLDRLSVEEDPEVVDAVIRALGRQGDADVVNPLLVELSGPHADVAAEALGRLGHRKVEGASSARVVSRLLDLIGSPSGFQLPNLGRTESSAAWALSRLGITKVSEPDRRRMEALLLEDRDPRVRAWVLRAWTAVATEPERGRVLPRATRDPAAEVRIAVARSLGRHATPGVEGLLIRLLADREEPVVLEAIAACGSAPGVEPGDLLESVLKDPNPRLVAAAISAMAARGALNPEPYLGVEQPLLVRVAATGALKDRDRLLQIALGDEQAAVRSAAAGALLDTDPGVKALTGLLRARDPVLVEATAEALREKPNPALEPVMVEVLGRKDLTATAAVATVRALSVLYFSGKLSRPSPEAGKRIEPWLNARELGDDGARLAGLLGLQAPAQKKLVEPPPQGLVTRVRSARVITDEGEFRIELFPEVAPYTVWNFVSLAETGYFDGLEFHRVVADFVAQTGDPRGDGWGGPGFAIPDELNDLPYREGAVGMALAGPDTGGSQWFVTVSPQPHLDAAYTVFGQVTVGMQAVRALDQGDHVQKIIIEWAGPPAPEARAQRPAG